MNICAGCSAQLDEADTWYCEMGCHETFCEDCFMDHSYECDNFICGECLEDEDWCVCD